MKKILGLFIALPLLFTSCHKDFDFWKDDCDCKDDPKEKVEKSFDDLVEENSTLLTDIQMVMEYNEPGMPKYGHLVNANGDVLAYRFEDDQAHNFSPGPYKEILNYFQGAMFEVGYKADKGLTADTYQKCHDLMKEYDKIVNETKLSPGAEGKGVCQLYHIQKSDPNVEEVSYYPMRLLKGEYQNDWYVDSETPKAILDNMNLLLNQVGGIKTEYWEHYGL